MAENNKYLTVSDDSEDFDYDLDLNETEMLWERKIEEVTAADPEMTGRDTVTSSVDVTDIMDDTNSVPSPSILSTDFSTDVNNTDHVSASKENSINALKDSLKALNDAMESGNSKKVEKPKPLVHSEPMSSIIPTRITQPEAPNQDQQGRRQTLTEIVRSIAETETNSKQKERNRLIEDIEEEKAVVVSFYDTIDLTDEPGTGMTAIDMTDMEEDGGKIPVRITTSLTPSDQNEALTQDNSEQASKYPEQGPVLSVKETSAESAEGMCTSCGKTKEKKLCTHRHHPYPQSPKPSQFQDPVPPSQNRGIEAVKKESKKLKYSMEVQHVKEIFPAVNRHFVKKLLKYLEKKFTNKQTVLQHAVTYLSDHSYPTDGDSQWEIDAAIDSLRRVVITPTDKNVPRKKEPKSNTERDTFVSNWITQSDFKKAMEMVSAGTVGADISAGLPDPSALGLSLFGLSTSNASNFTLGPPVTVSGTSLRSGRNSLGTSVASIVNSPCTSIHDSSDSSIASVENSAAKNSQLVGNSSESSLDSVKHLGGANADVSGGKTPVFNIGASLAEIKNSPNSGIAPVVSLSDMGTSSGLGLGLEQDSAKSQQTRTGNSAGAVLDQSGKSEMEVEEASGDEKSITVAWKKQFKRDQEKFRKAVEQYKRLKEKENKKLKELEKSGVDSKTENDMSGTSSGASQLSKDGASRLLDARLKFPGPEGSGSMNPRFHPYPQTEKHSLVGKSSSSPTFNFSTPLSSDKPDSVSQVQTVSNPIVSSSKEDDDMMFDDSVVSSSTIFCDNCMMTHAVKDLGQCCDGHLLCKSCLEKAAKLILVGNKSGQVICSVADCGSSVPRSELKKGLHSIMLDLLDEKWNKEAVDAMNDMEDFVRCPGCSYSVILDLGVKMHCCEKCRKTFCRYCTLDWNCKDHDLCIKTKNKKTADGSGVIAVPAHWSPSLDKESPYDQMIVDETALEFTTISELFYSSMARQSFRIDRLYRIQNQRLWEKYMLMRTHMVEDLGEMHINEKRLFHGTSSQAINAICKEGFDWRLHGKNGTAFGQGTYFAKDATYSHSYSARGGPLAMGRHGLFSHHFGAHYGLPPPWSQGPSPSIVPQLGAFSLGRGHYSNIGSQTSIFGAGQQQSGFQFSSSNIASSGQPQQSGFQLGNNSASGAQPQTGFQFGNNSANAGQPQQSGFQFGNNNSGSGGQPQQSGFQFGSSASSGARPLHFLNNCPYCGTGHRKGCPFGCSGANYTPRSGSHPEVMEESSGNFMFVGRVLVGRICRGQPKMRRPPNDESDPQKRPCHTAVNSTSQPTIYVVFESAQCYPEYLIEYSNQV